MASAHRPHTNAAPAHRRRVTRACVRLAALAAALAALTGTARAGVTVRDEVGAAGFPLTLAVRTTGRFLPAGGRLVDLFLEGRPLARVLTGGDGWGYHRFTPPAPGLFNSRPERQSPTALPLGGCRGEHWGEGATGAVPALTGGIGPPLVLGAHRL